MNEITESTGIEERRCMMGPRIRDKREELGLSQEELGLKLGVRKSAISKWESGEIENLKRTTIAKMAALFHCRPSWLMDLEDEDVTLTYKAPGKQPFTVKVEEVCL